jgi:hypothetical protein
MAFREKDELDWWVFGTYGLAMSHAQEFEFGLSRTIGHYTPDLPKGEDELWKLWKSTAGQLLARLRARLPSFVFEDLERLVDQRNWLAHDFFFEYSMDRLREEAMAREAVHRLDSLAQDFKDASMGLLVLRTRITPGFDTEEKMRMLWAQYGPKRPTD